MNAKYTDNQLKQALAKMLPDVIQHEAGLTWYRHDGEEVLNTELLHICWTVEETLTDDQWFAYHPTLIMLTTPSATHVANSFTCHSRWQQRTIALAKMKGVTIENT